MSKLFHTYDADNSGLIDKEEFLAILQMLDPEVEMEDVERTFKLIGGTDTLDKDQFGLWCAQLFGDYDDVQFKQQTVELIALSKQQRPDKVPSKMDPSELE